MKSFFLSIGRIDWNETVSREDISNNSLASIISNLSLNTEYVLYVYMYSDNNIFRDLFKYPIQKFNLILTEISDITIKQIKIEIESTLTKNLHDKDIKYIDDSLLRFHYHCVNIKDVVIKNSLVAENFYGGELGLSKFLEKAKLNLELRGWVTEFLVDSKSIKLESFTIGWYGMFYVEYILVVYVLDKNCIYRYERYFTRIDIAAEEDLKKVNTDVVSVEEYFNILLNIHGNDSKLWVLRLFVREEY